MFQRGLFRSSRPLELSYPDAGERTIHGYLDTARVLYITLVIF